MSKNKPHIEDEIFRVKNFINELTKIENAYFDKLADDYNFTEDGKNWLFDYIFNSGEEGDKLDFQEYLDSFDIEIGSLVASKKSGSKKNKNK